MRWDDGIQPQRFLTPDPLLNLPFFLGGSGIAGTALHCLIHPNGVNRETMEGDD